MEPAANQPPAGEQQEPVTGIVRLRVENVSEMAMERKYSARNEIAHFKWELVARKEMPTVPDGKKRKAVLEFEREELIRQNQLLRRHQAAARIQQQVDEVDMPRRARDAVRNAIARHELESVQAMMELHASPIHVRLRSRARRRVRDGDSNQSNAAATAGSSASGTVAADPNEQIAMQPEPFLSLMLVCAEQKTRPGTWSCTANVQIILSGPKKERTWTLDELTFANTDEEQPFNRSHIRINWAELMADYVEAGQQGNWIQVQAKLTIVEQIGYGLMSLNDVLIVNDCRFHVNKGYLAAFSNFFRAMFFAPALQNGALAADGEHQITDPTDNLNAFKLMLKIAHPESGQLPNDDLIVDVLHLADKYDLPNVTEQCEKFLMAQSKLPTIQKLGLADQYKLVNLKKQSVQQVQPLEFCELLEESVGVFNQLSEPLRRELGTHMKRRVRQARIVGDDDEVVHFEPHQPGPSASKRSRMRINWTLGRVRSPPPPPPAGHCPFAARLRRGSPPPPDFFNNGNGGFGRRAGPPAFPAYENAASSSSWRIRAAPAAPVVDVMDIFDPSMPSSSNAANTNGPNNTNGN